MGEHYKYLLHFVTSAALFYLFLCKKTAIKGHVTRPFLLLFSDGQQILGCTKEILFKLSLGKVRHWVKFWNPAQQSHTEIFVVRVPYS